MSSPNPNPAQSQGVRLLRIIFAVAGSVMVLAQLLSNRRMISFVAPSMIQGSETSTGASPTDGNSESKARALETTSTKHTYFDCSQIDSLTIVKEVGRGAQKTVFEVILPTGEHVAAKRCSSKQCETHKLILYEEFFYRKLHEAFGDKALAYYGFCSFNSGGKSTVNPEQLTAGSTLFIELGKPALEKWDNWRAGEKENRPKSNADLDNLRDIARQYDAFPGGPLRMHGDNVYPHQYMRNKAGQLRHIDFDMVEQMPPPMNSTLKGNCDILLGGFAKLGRRDPRLDCSVGYTEPNSTSTSTSTSTAAGTGTDIAAEIVVKAERKATEIVAEAERKATKIAAETALRSSNQNQNQNHAVRFNQTRPSAPFIISPLPSDMVLVHLGKTAGSTLSKNLKHGCHMFVPHPCRGSENRNYGTQGGPGEESQISQLTKGYYHFVPVPANKHDGYIISSRNPVDRVVSAFLYVHPSNVAFTTNHRAQFLKRNRGKENAFVNDYDKFFECFPDVTALALNLAGDSECAKFGRYVLGGEGKSIQESEMLNHFAFGYKFYTSNLLASKSRIFALRQEHLATDWINFNLRLGGAPHEMSGATKDFKDKLAVKKPAGGLSKEERRGLCVALAEELEVYLGVINAADNLAEEEKEESRREIRDGCSL